MVRRIAALLGLVILTGVAPPVAAQELPEYTADQRWARAEYLATSWVVLGIHYAKLKGDSVEEFSQVVFETYDPGWSMAYGPQEIMRAMNRNWSTYREGKVEVLETSPDRVRFRMNRPYVPFFGDNGEVSGVTVADYERMLEIFQAKICAKRGMAYTQTADGDWFDVTIERKGGS